jgi:hypothetical protein
MRAIELLRVVLGADLDMSDRVDSEWNHTLDLVGHLERTCSIKQIAVVARSHQQRSRGRSPR